MRSKKRRSKNSVFPPNPALCAARVRIDRRSIVWLRSVLEGYEGLALLHGDESGTVTIASPSDRARELAALLSDLKREASFEVVGPVTLKELSFVGRRA
ncbi:MAG: DUF4911 domain-containing protein [Proteobacteria bacterium]|nr:DUF4911 domain-containing protein [Pseudomonadota bacterium]